jgi:iron complex transport system substrate-binding protein
VAVSFERASRVAFLLALILTLGAGCAIAAPMRIVSLAPSVTETLFALGAGPSVVGVSQYCDYPPEVLKLPKVGTFLTPNLEAIIALRPTLIIGLGLSSDQRELRALKSMGFQIELAKDQSLDEIEDSIRKIGDATGHSAEAAQLIAKIDSQVGAVREAVADKPPLRVLMLVGHQPLIAVGRGTFLDDLLRLARSDNIADVSGEQWPQLSFEYIIAMRPEVILDGSMGSDPGAPAHFWDRYPSIPAVKDNRVFGYPDDPILHAGPRVGRSLEILAALIHPNAFAGGKVSAR